MALLTDEIRNTFRHGSALTRFIVVNLIVFAILNIIRIILFLLGLPAEDMIADMVKWLAAPADVGTLIFRPWTILTYMFLHEGLLHILFNMLWLYWFGLIFLEYLGSTKFVSTYFLGGLCGAVLYIVSFNLFPVFSVVTEHSINMGASAAVLAIVIAVSVYVPDYTVHLLLLGPVKIKYIAIVSVALDVLSIQGDNAGGHIAHLGGAIFGYFYARQLKKGNDVAAGFHRFLENIAAFFRYVFSTREKMGVAHTSSRKPFREADEEYNVNKARKQQRLDLILDKISKAGYDSLTNDEKELLFKFSKEE